MGNFAKYTTCCVSRPLERMSRLQFLVWKVYELEPLAIGRITPEFACEVGTSDGNFGHNAAMRAVGFGDVSGQNLGMDLTGGDIDGFAGLGGEIPAFVV